MITERTNDMKELQYYCLYLPSLFASIFIVFIVLLAGKERLLSWIWELWVIPVYGREQNIWETLLDFESHKAMPTTNVLEKIVFKTQKKGDVCPEEWTFGFYMKFTKLRVMFSVFSLNVKHQFEEYSFVWKKR